MKTTLRISVLLNMVLLGGLIFLWSRSQRPVAIPAPTVMAKVELPPPTSESAPVVVHEAAPPFHWNQLVSTNDYRVFVANLRASGCPESTVEDIVQGDAGRVFLMMRERLGMTPTEPGPWSSQAQIQLVANLLGQTPAGGLVANGQNNQEAGPATLMTFLQSADLTTPGMSDEQQQEVDNLRQSYLSQTAGATHAVQVPNSQADQQAQAETDGTQLSQIGNNNALQQRTQMSQTLLMATAEESMLAGMFGAGSAVQYDQYQAAQAGQQ